MKRLRLIFSKPHFFYLTFATIFGIAICVILPPFRGPDEAAHIFRLYEFSKGDLLLDSGPGGNGFMIPDDIQNVNIASFRDKSTSIGEKFNNLYSVGSNTVSSSTFQPFEGAGLYSPLSYIQYLPWTFLGSYFTTNMFVFVVILRIVGFLALMGLVYAAIRITPVGKWLFATVGLLPMTLHQMSVISTDGLIIASTLLFIALTLYLRNYYSQKGHDSDSKKRYIFILLLGITALIISSKPGYWPILFCAVLIAPSLSGVISKRLIFIPIIIAGGMMSYVMWYGILSSHGLSDMSHFFEQANSGSKLIGKKAVAKQIINPLSLSKRFIFTYVVQKPEEMFKNYKGNRTVNFQPTFVFSTFTGTFGSLEAIAPAWMNFTVPLAIILSIFIAPIGKSRAFQLKLRDRVISSLLIASSFMLISLIFLVSWTSESMPFIFGVQGRYFIPLLPLLVFILPRKKILDILPITHYSLLWSLIIINLIASLLTIVYYFY